MFSLCAKIKTEVNKKEYKKAAKNTLIALNEPGIKIPSSANQQHPLFTERIRKYETNIDNMNKKWPYGIRRSVSFGDSLMDGWTKKEFTAVDKDFNFNIAGSWHTHMRDVFRIMLPYLIQNKLIPRAIIIGCLGGNPFLARQPLQETIDYSISVLNDLRAMAGVDRIIVYGIPPTVSYYATKMAPEFEDAIYKWVRNDLDAAFLPLQRKFAKWGIIPKSVMTADGVHFTPEGIVEFDKLLCKAIDISFSSLQKRARIID